MKLKKLKIVLISIIIVLLLGFSFSACFAPQSPLSESPDISVTTRVVDASEYEQAFNDLAKERYEQALEKSRKGMLVAHADGLSSDVIKAQTRYEDKFINGTYATGIGLGLDIALSNVEPLQVGEDIELRFKSFYEVCGKQRYTYNGYIDGKYQPLFYETITCYACFVPSGSVQWYNGTYTPPDMPDWSLSEGVYPNDLCFERQLDTGETQYFIARFYDPSTQTVTATNYSGGNEFGVTFNFWYSDARVIDSTGTHTFSIPYDHPIRFVSSETNNIDGGSDYYNDPSSATYKSNIFISKLAKFFCSYVATNDRPENVNVINEPNFQTFNNYDYRKFPIYRVTNQYYQSYDNYGDYVTKYYGDTYINNGFTLDDNLKSTIDYDVFSLNVAEQLQPQFEAIFDAVYSEQPDIDMEFNEDNNNLNYVDIVNPSPPVVTGVGWQEPSYPAITTYAFQIEPVFPTSTYSAPDYLPETAADVYSIADRLLGPELLPIFLFLGLLGLCISILM